jgi:dTMP kinase
MAKTAGSLTPEEELDLFIKDRKENVRNNIKPALSGKKVVILDRYYYSTIAYQGAKGIDPAYIKRLNERFAVKPDLVFILDIEAGRGLGRIRNRKRKDLLFERERYLARVREIFGGFRGRRFVRLDAARPKEELADEIASRLLPLIKKWGSPRI